MSPPWHLAVVHKLTQVAVTVWWKMKDGHMHTLTHIEDKLEITVTSLSLPPLQLLLSYTATNCSLEGDLGNTPVILACSVNNCEAITILVCTKCLCSVVLYLHQSLKENRLSVQNRLLSCALNWQSLHCGFVSDNKLSLFVFLPINSPICQS